MAKKIEDIVVVAAAAVGQVTTVVHLKFGVSAFTNKEVALLFKFEAYLAQYGHSVIFDIFTKYLANHKMVIPD